MADLLTRAKEKFPEEPEENIVQGIEVLKQNMPEASDDEILMEGEKIMRGESSSIAPVSQPQESVDEGINDLMSRFSPEKRQEIIDRNKEESGRLREGVTSFVGGFGEALAGRSGAAGAQRIKDNYEQKRQSRLDQFDTQRDAALEEGDLKEKNLTREELYASLQEKQNIRARKKDPESNESIVARRLADEFDPSGQYDGMTAAELESSIPQLKSLLDARMQREDFESRKAERNSKRKLDEIESDKEQKALSDEEAQQVDAAESTIKMFESALNSLERGDVQTGPLVEALAPVGATERETAGFIRKSLGSIRQAVDPEVEKVNQVQARLNAEAKKLYDLGVMSRDDWSQMNRMSVDPANSEGQNIDILREQVELVKKGKSRLTGEEYTPTVRQPIDDNKNRRGQGGGQGGGRSAAAQRDKKNYGDMW